MHASTAKDRLRGFKPALGDWHPRWQPALAARWRVEAGLAGSLDLSKRCCEALSRLRGARAACRESNTRRWRTEEESGGGGGGGLSCHRLSGSTYPPPPVDDGARSGAWWHQSRLYSPLLAGPLAEFIHIVGRPTSPQAHKPTPPMAYCRSHHQDPPLDPSRSSRQQGPTTLN